MQRFKSCKWSKLPQLVVSASPITDVPFMAATDVSAAEDSQSITVAAEVPATAADRTDRLWISKDGRCGLQAKAKIVVFFNCKYLCFYAVVLIIVL